MDNPITPVKVFIVVLSFTTLVDVVECDVLPTLYKIVRFLEFPAALILPFSFIFKPLTFKSLKVYLK
jgi:hypothetical protein